MERYIIWSFLGTMPYLEALQLQLALRAGVAQGAEHALLLAEHPPVITLGRSADRRHIRASPDALASRGVEVHQVQRGGDVTYHAPGQLVGYPIRRLGRQVRAHVRGIVSALEDYVGGLGVACWWEDDNPGLWTATGKIAAVGVDARGGVSCHGFSLNICPDLRGFELIVPCGLSRPVTSLAACLPRERVPPVAEAASALALRLGAAFGETPREASASELCAWRR